MRKIIRNRRVLKRVMKNLKWLIPVPFLPITNGLRSGSFTTIVPIMLGGKKHCPRLYYSSNDTLCVLPATLVLTMKKFMGCIGELIRTLILSIFFRAGKCRLQEMPKEEGRASRMIPVEFYKKRKPWRTGLFLKLKSIERAEAG